ncbi:MAG TPA: hypothetical protein VK053_06805 [Jiangellaceae bacterium]|nr:hypothetical protein [Jiangellaceae bacterium]
MSATTASPFAALRHQWATEVDAPSAGASLKAWTSRHKCLRECRNLDDVVDAARDHRPDETYLALTREHQNGDTLATLVVLRALYNWTRATARRCQHRFDTLEDAEAATVIAIIEAATALPRDRQVRIVSYLTTRALNAVAGRSQRYGGPRRPEDVNHDALINHLDERAQEADRTDPHLEVLELLAWARDHKILSSTETSLLARCYTPTTGNRYETREAIAAELSITRGTLDQRCSRAVRKLRLAVVDRANTPSGR